jgi:dihydrolipoamide dehydrogenase
LLAHLKSYGVSAELSAFDLPQLVKRSRMIAQQLSAGVAFLMKKNKIDVVEGVARLEPGLTVPLVVVEREGQPPQELVAESVILARAGDRGGGVGPDLAE